MTCRALASRPSTLILAVLISCASLAAFILVLRYPFASKQECVAYDGFYCRPSPGQLAIEECPGRCWCMSLSATSKCGEYRFVASTAKWSTWKLPVLIVLFTFIVLAYVLVALTCMCRDTKNIEDADEHNSKRSGHGEEVYIAMQDGVAITTTDTDVSHTSVSSTTVGDGDGSLSTSSSSSARSNEESIEITFENGAKRTLKGVDPRTIPAEAWL